jgi:glycosyltransferase involved in cell wall biosynthesis
MEQSIKVSVIIPAYNRVSYLDQTIRSVLQQTYTNIELIVVDDGSTDGSYEKVKAYGEKLTLLTHENRKNKGQSAAINLGMKKVTGKYIAILDSDDYWELDKISIQVDFLEKNPDVGLLYSNGNAVNANGEKLYPIYDEEHIEPNDPNAVLLDCYIALPVNSLVRKQVYDVVGEFNETYRAAQDHDMLIRIAEVTKLAYLPNFLWYYRRHGDSISSKQQDIRWRVGFDILQSAELRYPYKTRTARKRKAVLNYRIGMCSSAEKKYLLTFWHMFKAFTLDPVRAIRFAVGIENRN